MTEKDKEILELLRQGKSYSYIQKIVQVSPSKIASVKKMYLENGNELSGYTPETIPTLPDTTITLPATTIENSGSSDTTTIQPLTEIKNSGGSTTELKIKNIGINTDYLKSQNNLIINLKKKLTMEQNEIFEDDDIEVIRLKMAHDIAMKNLEKENEELSLRKRELLIKEAHAFSEQKKTEKQGRSLLFRFRKLAEKIEDGVWTYGEINDCFNKTVELKEEIEKYCFENEIDSEDLSVITTLDKMKSELEELQDDSEDDDETIEVEFDNEILEMTERAKEVDFETYY